MTSSCTQCNRMLKGEQVEGKYNVQRGTFYVGNSSEYQSCLQLNNVIYIRQSVFN